MSKYYSPPTSTFAHPADNAFSLTSKESELVWHEGIYPP